MLSCLPRLRILLELSAHVAEPCAPALRTLELSYDHLPLITTLPHQYV